MLNGENPERRLGLLPGQHKKHLLIPGNNRHIPYVLLTNGGGVTEAEKASQISEILGVEVRYLKKLFRMAHDQV